MSGGKGGSSSTSVKIPEWLQTAAQSNLARADEIAKIGYTPYYGADVAGLTPMQQAAMANTNSAAAAFGMAAPTDPMAGMPQPQTFAGGVQGYSSQPMYQQSIEALAANDPAQYRALTAMFTNPDTGAQPLSPFGSAAPTPAAPTMGGKGGGIASYLGGGGGGSGSSNGGSPYTSINTPLSYAAGGVNTRNPSSGLNTAAAALTSSPQRAPTSSDRPAARPR